MEAIQSKNLHNAMLARLVRAKVAFFNAQPVGRILNRFAKDMRILDIIVPNAVTRFLWTFCIISLSLVVSCVAIPYLAIPVFFLIVGVICLRQKVMVVTRESMKLEAVTRSPMSTILSNTITGLATIRASNSALHFRYIF